MAPRQTLKKTAIVIATLLGGAAFAAAPAIALAQGPVGGVGQTYATSVTATVKAIDMATRHVTVTGPNGDTFTLKVGPDVRNLDQVKAGDKIKATYYIETLFVLSKPNTKLPDDEVAAAAARAPKGDLPAGVVANKTVVTGAVLGVDLVNYTLKIVDPSGGQVHTIAVTDPERQKQMAAIKVGDTITAFVTEALLITVDKP